ncbi:MAG: Fur family transcriptional regulator [Pontiellaceae bacterium]
MKKQRTTQQRKIIEEICFSSTHPLSIHDVEARGKKRLCTLNRVTVYRNLNRMVDAGELSRFTHPEKGTLYEQANRPHHHHFFCKTCEATFELPGCGLSLKEQTPAGFIVEGHEVFLNGICAVCAS